MFFVLFVELPSQVQTATENVVEPTERGGGSSDVLPCTRPTVRVSAPCHPGSGEVVALSSLVGKQPLLSRETWKVS